MKYGIIGLLLIIAEVSFAQPLTIKQIQSPDSTRQLTIVESSQRPEVAKKINAVIQKDWNYDANAKDPWENMGMEDEFSNDIAANNDRMLSMAVEGSHTGCGLHITRHVYNFDSHTGAPIDLNKLFGNEGQAKLRKALHKSMKAALKAAIADSHTQSYYLDSYKACLVEAEKITETDVSEMMLLDNGIKFWAGSCLEGTTYDFQADVSQGPHQYSLGQMLPMLTQYGYSLFVDKSSDPLQTLLRGTIDGKYAISLTLFPAKAGSPDGTIGGMIVYDRVGEPINLNGTITGNQFVLHELDASNNPLSDIEVTWDGMKLTGSFINLKSKKQMPFVASAVGGVK